MIQIVLGIIICVIGLFVFVKFPIKNNVKEVTLGALFIVLSIVLKRFAVMVPFLGFPSLKITLEVLPLIVAGLVLQPGYCFIVALATDGLGLILANAGGFPFFGFTLNAVLQTLIPCLFKQYLKTVSDELLEKIVKIGMIVLSVGACGYVATLNDVIIAQNNYSVTTPIKFALIALLAVMLGILFFFIQYRKKGLEKENLHGFYLCVISVVAIELSVTLFLTPTWLEIMYGIPFFASQFVRILKACVMIPAGIVIVYTLYRLVMKTVKF